MLRAFPAFVATAVAAATGLKKWQVLGPFVIGKNELDGEPWLSSNFSELLGRSARPKTFRADAGSAVTVSWGEVDWQSLVNSVGGTELLEWQAKAVGVFKTDGSELRIRCQGVPSFTVEDSIAGSTTVLVGDLYWAKLPPHPVKLAAGSHRISLRLRGKLQTQFACHIEKASAAKSPLVLFADSFAALPDLALPRNGTGGGLILCGAVGVGVANQDTDRWITDLQPVLKKNKFLSLAPQALRQAGRLAPKEMTRAAVQLEVLPAAESCEEVWLDLAFRGKSLGAEVISDSVRLRLKCRDVTRQSFVFTFQDVDGSLQHAAAVQPQSSAQVSCGGGGCPVVVTLSGTSITARDSADAYKMKFNDKDPEYRFGIEGAWLLAPTRHGAHNWEGPGRSTALSALKALPQLAQQWRLLAVDAQRVVVAGHSMGGHGAWLFAFAHDVLAVISSASWLRKDQYADSNKVLLHDVATPKVEPMLAALLRQAEAEFDVEAQVGSLAHLPVLIRVGSQDRTVHPWFSRRIYRILLSEGAQDVTFTELPGKEHWWWDTNSPNDGGAVNDREIRSFVQRVLAKEKSATPRRWKRSASGSAALPRVLAQKRPDLRSEVTVELPDASPAGPAVLDTFNVLRLHWRRSKAWQGLNEVLLDGQLLNLPEEEATWCLAEGTWHRCQNDAGQRHANQAGPMRRIYEAPLCGVSVDQEGDDALQFFGNMLVMTSHGVIRMLAREEVEIRHGKLSAPGCENLLVLGAPESPVVAALLATSSITFSASSLELGDCAWKRGDHLAVLSLLPWTSEKEPRLALVVTGATTRSAAQALTLLSTPTIPPMARQPLTHLLPDYVVLDVEETRRHGPGGYLAAGFWDDAWRPLPSAYSTRCHAKPKHLTQVPRVEEL